jgi:AcrR family transcriptional regulator
MSSSVDKGSRADSPASKKRRPHDSQASRRALLEAAQAAFDEVGYDRATTREIGERAGIDPALIARYFGSKEGLYLAAIAAGAADEGEFPTEPKQLLAFLFERWDERGHNPLTRALVSPSLSEEARSQVSGAARGRMERQVEALREHGVSSPELRMELLAAVAVGVAMTRSNRTLETLAAAPREEILELLAPFVDSFEPD